MPGLDANALLALRFNGEWTEDTGRHTVAHTANASIDSSTYKFGGGSGEVLTDSYLSPGITAEGNLSDFVFTGDYCVEQWVRIAGAGAGLGIGGPGSGGIMIYVGSSGYIGWGVWGGWSESDSTMQLTPEEWYYLCAERYGSTMVLSLNGTVLKSRTNTDTIQFHNGSKFCVWRDDGSEYDSHIDGLRVSNVSRYGAGNFSPPDYEFDGTNPIIALSNHRLSRESGFHPGLIGGHAINTNRTYFHAPKTYAITISSDVDNINLRDEADDLGYAGEDEAIVTCEIEEGVEVTSLLEDTPAFDVGTWPEGFSIPITITNRGSIIGYDSEGAAFKTETNIYVDNYGTIRATGSGLALDGVALMAWGNVGLVEGETDEDFFGYHTKPWLLRRLSRELFPIEILRGRVWRRRATHMYDLYNYRRDFIQEYRVADNSLDRYELYLNGSATPDATSATLPFTKELDIPISGVEEISILVKKRNRFGLVSFNQNPTTVEINSYGDEELGPLTPPKIMYLSPAGVDGLLVRASYSSDSDRNPADHWKIFAKEGEEPDPESDTALASGTIKRGAGASVQIAGVVSGFTSGSDVYVVVQVYREEDERSADSDSDYATIRTAPSVSALSASMFGGSTVEIK